jgi:hypothetical protein
MREQNPFTSQKFTSPPNLFPKRCGNEYLQYSNLFPQRCGDKIPFTLKKITAPQICSRNHAGTKCTKKPSGSGMLIVI